MLSAHWKIRLRALVLLVGVLVFVFYVFAAPPLYFNPVEARAVAASDSAAYARLETRYTAALGQRADAARAAAAAREAGDRPAATRELAAFPQRNADVTAVRRALAVLLGCRQTGKRKATAAARGAENRQRQDDAPVGIRF